jgi:Pyruvate/2-oxoacid:ferredoxin oxidoreductase delta subunit
LSEQLWRDAAATIVGVGKVPVPVTDTLLELLQTIMDEKEAGFIRIFSRSLNMEEIRERSDLDEASLQAMLEGLMDKGVIVGIPSRSTGMMVYSLMPPVPGLFEFTFMRGKTGERERKLARLYEELFGELAGLIQDNYDAVMDLMRAVPPMTRIVPVGQEVPVQADSVIPCEDVRGIVEKFETIAVANCYCRHHKSLLGRTCSVTEENENCLLFGRTARFVIEHDFGRQISREEALRILDESREAGLVHKAFHVKLDIEKDETAICNCCKCCCETFRLYYEGAAPMQTYTSYIARVDEEGCTACGICADMCPMEAVEVIDERAVIDGDRCIGCGVCAYHCAAQAIELERTGNRAVFVPPKRRG